MGFIRRVLYRPYHWCFEREKKIAENFECLGDFERLKDVWIEFEDLGNGQKPILFVNGRWSEDEVLIDLKNKEWKVFLVEAPKWLDEVRKVMVFFNADRYVAGGGKNN